MKKGLLIVYSGPSGVGKGTVRAKLFEMKELNLAYSISMTTRLPRVGEKDGVDYFFVTKEKFEEAIKEDKLLEHANFVGNYYGTPKDYVEKLRNQGLNVMLEIEVYGAMQVLEKVKDAVSIFILPPSEEELRNRIINRKTENSSTIQKRLDSARNELTFASKYQYNVINDDVDKCANEIKQILLNIINK